MAVSPTAWGHNAEKSEETARHQRIYDGKQNRGKPVSKGQCYNQFWRVGCRDGGEKENRFRDEEEINPLMLELVGVGENSKQVGARIWCCVFGENFIVERRFAHGL